MTNAGWHEVALHDSVIGRLVRMPRGELVFEYAADVGTADRLSVGAPARRDWDASFSRAWFEGLLPEGAVRSRIAARFGVSAEDTFGLLGAIGWECAGAVAVRPPGTQVTAERYQRLTDNEVGERLDALPAHPYDDDAALRVSLGGMRDKLMLARIDDRWLQPLDGAPTTHILKPEPAEWPGMAVAEAWALRLAATATPAADATVSEQLGGRPALVVTRFDRRFVRDTVVRIHQEDACQALGLLPTSKYSEHPGRPRDPSYAKLAALLRDHASNPVSDLLRLLEQVTVHVVLMNADAHAKNLSLLHNEAGFVSLAPMYDALPTVAFLTTQRHAALPVAGTFRLDQITRDALVVEADSWGVAAGIARSTVERVLIALDEGIALSDDAYPSLDPRARLAVTGQLFRLRKSR